MILWAQSHVFFYNFGIVDHWALPYYAQVAFGLTSSMYIFILFYLVNR